MPERIYPNEYCPFKVIPWEVIHVFQQCCHCSEHFWNTPLLALPSESAAYSFDIILSDGKSSSFEGGFDFWNCQKSFGVKTDE